MLNTFSWLLPLCLVSSALYSQEARPDKRSGGRFPGARVETYKTIGDVQLRLWIFAPPGHGTAGQSGEVRRPAVVFFFGGGWRSGTPAQFRPHAEYLAERGMVTVLADYRVSSRHGTKALQCVQDAKSAVRWLRTNAKRLGVDPERIVASGGSAGGHIAACTGVIPGLDEPGEATTVSSVPNALVLFNPVVVLAPVRDVSPADAQRVSRFVARLGTEPRAISPYHHVKKGAPPTLIFHGTADRTVPFATVELFAKAMQKAGNRCELVPREGADHGFFNHGRGDGSAYTETLARMDSFLVDLGYLAKPKTTAGNAAAKR